MPGEFCFLCSVVLLSVVLLVGVISSSSRREANRRAERMFERLHEVERRLRALESRQLGQSTTPHTAREPDATREPTELSPLDSLPKAPPIPYGPPVLEAPSVSFEPPTSEAAAAMPSSEPALPAVTAASPVSSGKAVEPPPLPGERGADLAARGSQQGAGTVDWERWVGVRGAAVLGGVLLALAGVFLFKHAVEQGWVTPTFRVLLGVIAGVVALLASEPVRRRGYATTAAAIVGGGTVVLYASVWAGSELYSLLPWPFSVAGMIAITLTCCLLAVRHDSQVIAILGLCGGFATPLLLSFSATQPIGFFAYVLLLDLGLLVLGRRQRWELLAATGVLGTLVLELVWMAQVDSTAFTNLGLVVFALFGLLFALVEVPSPRRPITAVVRAIGVLAAYALGLLWLVDPGRDLGLVPIAVFSATLAVASLWLGQLRLLRFLSPVSAGGSVALITCWAAFEGAPSDAWGICAAIVLTTYLFWIADRRLARASGQEQRGAAIVVAVAGYMVLSFVRLEGHAIDDPWPWWVAIVGLLPASSALVYRRELNGVLFLPGLVLAAAVLFAMRVGPFGQLGLAPAVCFAAAVVALVLASVYAWIVADWMAPLEDSARESTYAGVAIGALTLMLITPWMPAYESAGVALVLGSIVAFALFVLWPAVRLARGAWWAVAAMLAIAIQGIWAGIELMGAPASSAFSLALWLCLATPWALAAIALVFRASLGVAGMVSAASAAGFCIAWPIVRWLAVVEFGQPHGELMAVVLGLGAIVPLCFALQRLRSVQPASDARSEAELRDARFAATCHVLAACLLVTLGLTLYYGFKPTQLIAAVAALCLYACRWAFQQRALGPVALFAATISVLAVATSPWLGERYMHSGMLLFNEMSLVLFVPLAAFLIVAALAQRDAAASDLRQGDRDFARFAAATCSTFAVVTGFVWLNLSIFDCFGGGEYVRFELRRWPLRDLVVSISWAAYGLGLLGLGLWRQREGPRWLSLAVLMLTLTKVFLHDLGELSGLHRVASLFGLALSMLLVSVLYQRFVFKPAQPMAA